MMKKINNYNDVSKIVGKNIKHFRTINNLSQQQLELEAGINTNYITNIELATKDIKLSTLCKISEALDIDISELFVEREIYESKKRIDKK